MLILSRKLNQSVELVWNGPPLLPGTKIGHIKVLLIDRDQIKLGFACLQELNIARDDIKKDTYREPAVSKSEFIPPPPPPSVPITKTAMPANINLKRI